MKLAEKQQTEGLKQNELKRVEKLMDAGWPVFPSVILERQQALGLDATDVNILIHLARHWWYADTCHTRRSARSPRPPFRRGPQQGRSKND